MRIPSINVGKRESYFRTAFGITLVIIGSYTYWWLIFPGLLLIATATSYYCPLCHMFNIRSKASIENFYLSYLPRYNSQPTCIFNRQGELNYTNSRFDKILPHVSSLHDLCRDFPEKLSVFVTSEQQHRCRFETGDTTFQVLLHGIRAIDGLVGYLSDITDIVKLDQEIIDTQKEIVFTMGEIGESRSKETGNHVRRVAEYSKLLAIGYGLSLEEAELIRMASPMHDIGKVGIADSILKKPGKLTTDEYEVMKTHAQMGHDMLNHSGRPILKAAAIIAGEHHEKWDGSGYPHGTKGGAIHLYGRITAIADVFDALGSDRVYKKAWPLEKILTLFQQERSSHFDPGLVDILFGNLEQFKKIRVTFNDTVTPPETGGSSSDPAKLMDS